MLDTHGGPRFEAPIFAAINTLQVYLWIAVFNALILISWARYQQRRGRQFARRRAEARALTDKNLSDSFSLAEGELEQLHHRVKQRMHARYEELGVLLDDQPDYPLASDRVRRLMFLEKLLFDIDDAMAALED